MNNDNNYSPDLKRQPVIDPVAWPHYWNFRALSSRGKTLEIGPGLRPQLDLSRAEFIDSDPLVVEKLAKVGAQAQVGEIENLPYGENSFSLIGCFYCLHLVDDDRKALREIMRVLSPQGHLVLSVPLHAKKWNFKDTLWQSKRRYEPEKLNDLISSVGFRVCGVIPLGGRYFNFLRFLEKLFFRLFAKNPQLYFDMMHDIAVPWYKIKLLGTSGWGRQFLPPVTIGRLSNYSGVLLLLKPEFE